MSVLMYVGMMFDMILLLVWFVFDLVCVVYWGVCFDVLLVGLCVGFVWKGNLKYYNDVYCLLLLLVLLILLWSVLGVNFVSL